MTAHRISGKDNIAMIHALALGAFLLAAMPAVNTMAQGLDSEGSAETIVGSKIATDDAEIRDVVEDVVAAIEDSSATADTIRKMFRVDDFHIVFLGNREKVEGMEKVQAALEKNSDAVTGLREAIDGSSVFYTALETNNLDVENVVSATVSDEKAVTAYVIGEAP